MTNLLVPKGGNLPLWKPRQLRKVWEQVPEDILDILLNPAMFYQMFVRYEGQPLRLDGWQVAFLNRKQRFRALEKSVQIGYSFVCAMEALHMAFFYEDEDSVFVSVNEKDAHNKVLFARKLYDGIPVELRRYVPLVKDSAEELWFGKKERPARLMSKPASAGLRGIAAHIYLDEVDHWQPGSDQEVFTAAMGRVTRAKRRLTVGSSVFGEDTILAQLMKKDDYPSFLKFKVPYWACEVQDVLDGIALQKANMAESDFLQEYACVRGDAIDTAFPQDLIRRCWSDKEDVGIGGLPEEGRFLAGFDPGGSRHPAVLTVLEETPLGWSQATQLEIRNETLASQQARIDGLLAKHPGMRVAIDRLGVGQHMSEDLLRKWGSHRVIPVLFSKQSKGQMVLDLKKLMENGELRILRDRELAHQLNRTRRRPGGDVEQTGSTKKTHYDRFWALAMATSLVYGAKSIYEVRGMRSISIDDEDDENEYMELSV